ncbi:tyrosine-protein phosphatase [Microbacterium sp.]|uniref:tyrosine-protein phosphatase n=1 Tax=Microbacterium sp. TaxID=51671 RepID=UPI003F7206A9
MTVLTGLEGTFNFRDLGGLPTSGDPTAYGVLYRSDALHALTPAGEAELAASGIGVIVDFRTEEERITAPDRRPDARKIREVHLPLLEGAMSSTIKEALTARVLGDHTAAGRAAEHAMANLPKLGDMYVSMLEHGAASFAQVARYVAAPADPAHPGVLVHCTAGKDRTGVATAVLLDAAGVHHDAIIADYAQTQQNLEGAWLDGMTAMVEKFGVTVTPELAEMMGGSPPAAIEEALAWLDAHGGSAAYLRSGGLTDTELAAFREKLAG